MHTYDENHRHISSAYTVLLTDSIRVEYRSNSSRQRTQLLSISYSKQPINRFHQYTYSRSNSCPSIRNTLTDLWKEFHQNQLQPLNHPKRQV